MYEITCSNVSENKQLVSLKINLSMNDSRFQQNTVLPYICRRISFVYQDFLGSSVSKESACSAGGRGLIPGWGRCPGEGNGKPLQYCCLENPMDGGAWWATVHWIARVGHDLVTKPSPSPPPFVKLRSYPIQRRKGIKNKWLNQNLSVAAPVTK